MKATDCSVSFYLTQSCFKNNSSLCFTFCWYPQTTNSQNKQNIWYYIEMMQFSSVQSLSRVRLFATPWIAACQASLSITTSRSSLKLTWTTIWYNNFTCGYIKRYTPPCLLQHYSQWPRYVNNLSAHQSMNKEVVRYIYTHTHTHTQNGTWSSHEKKYPAICESWQDSAKWNKPNWDKYYMVSFIFWSERNFFKKSNS